MKNLKAAAGENIDNAADSNQEKKGDKLYPSDLFQKYKGKMRENFDSIAQSGSINRNKHLKVINHGIIEKIQEEYSKTLFQWTNENCNSKNSLSHEVSFEAKENSNNFENYKYYYTPNDLIESHLIPPSLDSSFLGGDKVGEHKSSITSDSPSGNSGPESSCTSPSFDPSQISSPSSNSLQQADSIQSLTVQQPPKTTQIPSKFHGEGSECNSKNSVHSRVINNENNVKCVFTYEDKYNFRRIVASDTLIFNSHFESGNLNKAYRIYTDIENHSRGKRLSFRNRLSSSSLSYIDNYNIKASTILLMTSSMGLGNITPCSFSISAAKTGFQLIFPLVFITIILKKLFKSA